MTVEKVYEADFYQNEMVVLPHIRIWGEPVWARKGTLKMREEVRLGTMVGTVEPDGHLSWQWAGPGPMPLNWGELVVYLPPEYIGLSGEYVEDTIVLRPIRSRAEFLEFLLTPRLKYHNYVREYWGNENTTGPIRWGWIKYKAQ